MVAEMSSKIAPKNKFRIERLEERIAPSLVLSGISFDFVPTTGESVGLDTTPMSRGETFDPLAALCALIGMPAIRSSMAQTSVAETSAAVMANSESSTDGNAAQQNVAMPAWAAELLGDIRREFDQFEDSRPGVVDAGVSSQLRSIDELLAGVSHNLNRPATHSSAVNSEIPEALPAWANDFLRELQQTFDKPVAPESAMADHTESLAFATR